jgi:hypothetical protein
MNRATILEQLSSGQLSADEAAQLLSNPNPPATGGPSPAKTATPLSGLDPNRRLRVRVTNLQTGRDRVNVYLPLTLVEAGLKLGARYEPRIANLDFNEILEQIHSGSNGQLVDVEDWEDGQRVEIFID